MEYYKRKLLLDGLKNIEDNWNKPSDIRYIAEALYVLVEKLIDVDDEDEV